MNEDLNKIIEKTVETKFNHLLETIPKFINREERKDKDDFFNFSILEIYHNTLQTIIDIINEVMTVLDNTNKDQYFYKKLLNIFLNENRMFYIGIILIFLSFIIYFIDGASI